MLKNRTLLASGFVLLMLLALVGVWYWASPLWTLHEMHLSAEENDSDRLSGYIDYPSLRENLKSQLRAKAAAELAKSKQSGGNPFEALGAVMGASLVDGIVDTMVSPQGLKVMFDQRAVPNGHSPFGFKANEASEVDRAGFDEFRLVDKAKGGDLIFARYGLGWKLAGIDVAPSDPDAASSVDNCPGVDPC